MCMEEIPLPPGGQVSLAGGAMIALSPEGQLTLATPSGVARVVLIQAPPPKEESEE